MTETKKRKEFRTRREPLNMRMEPGLRARLEKSAKDRSLSLTSEATRRLERSFEHEGEIATGLGMPCFWAWFDGVTDACGLEEQRLLGLMRRRLEAATGTRSEAAAPVALKAVESA